MKTRFKSAILYFSAISLMLAVVSCDPKPKGGDDGTPSDVVTNITKDTTWTGVVKFQGKVRIPSGVTLTIQPGTICKAVPGYVTTLIVERGAKIVADGSMASPIVFTSGAEAGGRRAGDWGGIIICGKAKVNKTNPSVEGLDGTLYGGEDNADNSGTLRYCRIEYAGYPVQIDKELNSLTLAGVGAGTTLEYIQVSYANDDSFEMFGGTVNLRNIIAYHGWDDDIDTDFGYQGMIQNALVIRHKSLADVSKSNGFESDNDGEGSDATPLTAPVISNITFVGPIVVKSDGAFDYNALHANAMHIRRNSRLKVFNAVAVNYPSNILLESSGTQGNEGFELGSSYFGILKTAKAAAKLYAGSDAFYAQKFSAGSNVADTVASVADFKINAYGLPQAQSPILRVSPAYTHSALSHAFFVKTGTQIGAFSTGEDWTLGWTEWDPNSKNY